MEIPDEVRQLAVEANIAWERKANRLRYEKRIFEIGGLEAIVEWAENEDKIYKRHRHEAPQKA